MPEEAPVATTVFAMDAILAISTVGSPETVKGTIYI
jgi:hypothetical protein